MAVAKALTRAVRSAAEELGGLERVQRVVVAVLIVYVRQTVEGIRSALHYRVELSARRVPEFWRKLILQQREFRHRIVGNRYQGPSDALVVVVHALDGEVVVARTLSTDRRTAAYANASARANTSAEERQVQNSAAGADCRQICEFLALEGALHLCGRSIQSRSLSANLDRGHGTLDFQSDLEGRVSIKEDFEPIYRRSCKIRRGRCYVIRSHRQIVDAVFAVRAGRCRILHARCHVYRFHLRACNCRAGLI